MHRRKAHHHDNIEDSAAVSVDVYSQYVLHGRGKSSERYNTKPGSTDGGRLEKTGNETRANRQLLDFPDCQRFPLPQRHLRCAEIKNKKTDPVDHTVRQPDHCIHSRQAENNQGKEPRLS
jgi:hypothetical protein